MAADKQHNWLKSGAYNLAQNIQSLVFGFGGFYLLVRLIDKDLYGIWVLFIATTTIFDTARSGLIQNALIKFLSSNPKEQHPEILSASIALNAILMAAAIILNISLAGVQARLWHYPGLVKMFYIYNLVYVAQGVLAQFQWVEQSHLRFSGILVSSIIRQGGPFFYILACVLFKIELTLVHLIYAQFFATALAAVVEYFFVRKYWQVNWKINIARVKELFNYGKYVFSTSISVMILSSINQWFLGTMINPAAAGVFNVATRISNLTEIPVNALCTMVFPQSVRRFTAEGDAAGKYLYERSVGIMLAILLPALIFLCLFPTWVITIIAGSKYIDTAPMMRLFAVACLFVPFNRMFGTIMDSTGRPKLNFYIILGLTLVETGFTYTFVKLFGLVGAIEATLAAMFTFFVIMQIILHKIFKVNFLNAFQYAVKFYGEMINSYLKPMLAK